MMNLDEISFTPPQWLLIYYFSAGFVSVLISTFCVYLILFRSVKIGNFKYFLLWFNISCAVTDVSMTILLRPVALLPIWALYSVGYAWKLLGIPFRETTLFFVFWVGEQFAALVCCFLYKHQTISQLGSKLILSKSVFTSAVVSFQFAISAFVVFFFYVQNDQETALRIAHQIYPSLAYEFDSLQSFQLFAENKNYPLFLAFCVFAGTIVVLAVGGLTWHMIHILNGNRRKMSGTNFQRHKNAVNSLVAQPIYSQEISYLMCAVFSSHSTINCLILIATSPAYRRIFTKRKPSSNSSPSVFMKVASMSHG
ncbi:unnamed protein product [Caenorhabditis sp. 36 PRJEB53466]|nr:unnamed protein product [Caenorhabditis sp. 36 PRJEB53466]